MTHTPPSEAAASSPFLHQGYLESAANRECDFPEPIRVLAAEVLRMRAQCPPTAEVEKLRHAAREANSLRLHLSNINSALTEAGQPHRHLAGERDAWKRNADACGGGLTPLGIDWRSALVAVDSELAKAGVTVTATMTHAEAVAQLRGARDRWRERFEAADKESGATAKRILAMCDLLAEAGFSWTGAESHAAGLRNAVNAALAELARLRKESKRDQVAKQQAIIDEVARLFPGKGPLLERVRAASKDAPITDLQYDRAALDAEVEKRGIGSVPATWREGGKQVLGFFGSCKVGPATGQPRTEVPVGPDGSGTVVELGEAFREEMRQAGECATEFWRLRHLHAAVTELAKVVERGGRL